MRNQQASNQPIRSVKIGKSNLPKPSNYLSEYFWRDLYDNLLREYPREVTDFIFANKRQEIIKMIDSAVEGSHVQIDLK